MIRSKTQKVAQMGGMFALLIVSAKLVIPLPLSDYISLQIIVVFLLYPLLGEREALLVFLTYLILGLMGLPIFASGSGFAYALKPTFGFLIAYTLLPIVQCEATRLFNRHRIDSIMLVNYLGLIFIHVIGIGYKVWIVSALSMNGAVIWGILSVSTVLDFSSDVLLVFIAGILAVKLRAIKQ